MDREIERCHVCIFAKVPVAGAVKTRLAPAIGIDGAADLAAAFLQDCWSMVNGMPWAVPVLASASPPGRGWRRRLGYPSVWSQGAGDLGQRIERVLRRAVGRKGRPALVLGTDSPGLPPRRLEDARRALRSYPAVMGRSDDGGFYLLGLRRCPPGLLAGLPWSTPVTADAVVARLEARGLPVAQVEPWFDVDCPADLDRLRILFRQPHQASPAPCTRAVLQRLVPVPVSERAQRS